MGISLCLLVLLGGCNSRHAAARAKKPFAKTEGESWSIDQLTEYLNASGIELHSLGVMANAQGDTPDVVALVDDRSALTRRQGPVGLAMLSEKRAGTGAIMVMRYRSPEFAGRQIRPGEESSLLWGRFIIVVVDPHPPNSGEESGNARSRRLIQEIRAVLGP